MKAKEDIVFAIGDIHGRADLLQDIQEKIQNKIQDQKIRNPIIVYLGDYVDRGPYSAQTIDLLINGLPEFRKFYLKGNHEDLFQSMLEHDFNLAKARHWIKSGGDATLRSYGIECEGVEDFDQSPDLYKELLLGKIPKEHIEFIKGLKYFYQNKSYIFVHAGLNPNYPLSKQNKNDLMWIRDEFLNSKKKWSKLIVHGHTPRKFGPDLLFNRLNIDTSAHSKGTLTCAMLSSKKVEFIVSSTPREFTILVDPQGEGKSVWNRWALDCACASKSINLILCTPKSSSLARTAKNKGLTAYRLSWDSLIKGCSNQENEILQSLQSGQAAISFCNREKRNSFQTKVYEQIGLDVPAQYLR